MDFGVATPIPVSLLLDENLSPSERVLYGILSASAVKGTCALSDEQLAKHLRFKSEGVVRQLSTDAVARMLTNLEKHGYITVKVADVRFIKLPFLLSEPKTADENVATAKKVLTYLSECAIIRGYRKNELKAVKSNLESIVARLKEGHTYEECISVINVKFEDDFFKQHIKFLTPQTLFRPANFERYLAEAGTIKDVEKKVVTKYGLASAKTNTEEQGTEEETF